MTIAGPGRDTYRQAKRSRVFAMRLVKEPLAEQISLRCTLSRVGTCDFGRVGEIHGSEKQIPSIRPDHNGVLPHLFDAVGAMIKCKLVILAVGPADEKQWRVTGRFRIAPTTARSIEEIVTHETVLKAIALDPGQRQVIRGRALTTSLR